MPWVRHNPDLPNVVTIAGAIVALVLGLAALRFIGQERARWRTISNPPVHASR